MSSPPPLLLPHAPILTYVTGGTTAARLRRVLLWGLRSAAALYALSAAALLLYLASPYFTHYRVRSGWTFYTPYSTAPPSPLSTVRDLLLTQLPLLLALLFLLAAAITLLLITPKASRGNRTACTLANLSLLPLFLLFLTAAVASGLLAIGMTSISSNPLYLSFAPFTLLSLFAILLLKDLTAYVQWARQNPSLEKPPTPFLPARTDASLTAAPSPSATPDPALPRSPFLSFLLGQPTPQKLRTTVAWGLRTVGLLSLLPAFLLALQLLLFLFDLPSLLDLTRHYLMYSAVSIFTQPLFRLAITHPVLPILLAALLTLSALTLLLTAGPASRAHRLAATLSLLALLPPLLLTFALTLDTALYATLIPLAGRPQGAFLYIPALLLLFLTLLLKDLATCTLWSLKHPIPHPPFTSLSQNGLLSYEAS